MLPQKIWKNILFNSLGQAWQVLLALGSVPILVRGLGVDLYGLLSLLGASLNVVFLMDLGIGAALVKYIAELDAKRDRTKIARLIGSCILFYGGLGVLFFILLISFAKVLLQDGFRVPSAFLEEATLAFYVGAFSVLFAFPLTVLISIPVALQRMDLSSGLNTFVGTLNILGAVILVSLGQGLVSILAWQVLTILIYFGLAVWVWRRYFSYIEHVFCLDWILLYQIFRFSGFKIFSSLSGIVVFHLDRLLVGTFFPLRELAYYTVAVTIAQKLITLVTHVTVAVFPAVSSFHGGEEAEKARQIYIRYSKLVVLLTLPLAVGLFIFPREILQLWVGPEFAYSSQAALRALSIGFLLAAFAGMPGVFAEGMGRPDIPALFACVSAALNLSFTLLLIPYWGTAAPGIGLTLNALAQVPWFIHTVNRSIAGLSSGQYLKEVFARPFLAGIVLVLLFSLVKDLVTSGTAFAVLVLVGFLVYGGITYINGTFTDQEKRWIQTRLRSFAIVRG